MDVIKQFINSKYMMWNVNEDKSPRVGINELGWSKIRYDKVKEFWDMNSKQWGIRTGWQPNGKNILGLDFDMWYKQGGEYVASVNTRKLYAEFEKLLGANKHGVFTSSTDLNKGVLCDITNSKKIIKMLDEDGRRKLQAHNYHLELLACFNMVLPPSATKCKLNNTILRKRQYLSDIHILEIDENGEIEKFIIDYIEKCKTKKILTKRDMRQSTQKDAYLDFESNDNKNELHIKNIVLIKPFLDNLDEERGNNYNEWFKIGLYIIYFVSNNLLLWVFPEHNTIGYAFSCNCFYRFLIISISMIDHFQNNSYCFHYNMI